MLRRTAVTALAVVLSLVAVACGDPTTAPGAAPATEPPAGTAAPSGTDVPATEALATEPTMGESLSTTMASSETVLPSSTVLPLGGVTIDDPLPSQVDSSIDPAAAEAAVRFAYQHWILVDLDPALRARLVEDGEATSEGLEQGIAEARSIIEFGRIAVDEVQFTGVDSADVVFRVQWQDGPSPYFPDPMRGTALFRDGSWRISRRSLCLLAFGVGQDCAGPSTELPVAPAGFAVTVLPDGLQWIGSPTTPDLVAVPGTSMWSSDPSQLTEPSPADGVRSLNLTTEVLVGSSALGDDDAAMVLTNGRFGIADGVAVAVADGRARALEREGYVQLVALRDDDVVVSAYAQGLTIAELVAIVDGLTPTELPDGFEAYVEIG